MTFVFVDRENPDVRALAVHVMSGRGQGAPGSNRPLPPARDEFMAGTGVQQADERVLLQLHADVVALREREHPDVSGAR